MTFSKGCIVQIVALLLPFIGALLGPNGAIIGTVLMLILVFIGGRISTKWFCGNCGKPISGKRVSVCPSCKAEFTGIITPASRRRARKSPRKT